LQTFPKVVDEREILPNLTKSLCERPLRVEAV
jgi:hypothetical protein